MTREEKMMHEKFISPCSGDLHLNIDVQDVVKVVYSANEQKNTGGISTMTVKNMIYMKEHFVK